jgi:transposase
VTRYELTDRQWQRLEPLLPPERPPTGRPNHHHRTILNGILWVLRTGAPWRDLPERYGPWRTVASRIYRWQRAGIWAQLFSAVQAQADAQGQLNWDLHDIDGTIIRAHQHAAGAKKGTQRPKPLAGAGAGSVPKSTCGPKEAAS